jgi:uncharacterized membrane protein
MNILFKIAATAMVIGLAMSFYGFLFNKERVGMIGWYLLAATIIFVMIGGLAILWMLPNN